MLLVLAACLGGPARARTQDAWQGLGDDSTRAGWRHALPADLSRPAWIANTDETGVLVSFLNQAGVAFSDASLDELVYALGRVSRPGGPVNQARLLAFRRDSGQCEWSVPVASPVLDSLSTPVLDVSRGRIVVCSGRFVQCFDARTGTPAWSRELDRVVVNASPAITHDRAGRDRLFITDYDGFGSGASLYCINVSPQSAANPFLPGDLVWQAPIGGASGNSPAYLPARLGGFDTVFVASVGEFAGLPGRVFAFPVESVAPPEAPLPLWVFENVIPEGFFGGLSIAPPYEPGAFPAYSGRPHVYVASYAFTGSFDSANLVKIDALTGTLVWSAPCPRTQSTPVVLPDRRVLVSAGVRGFGSLPTLRLFHDWGATVTLLWDTALDSWVDLDSDGLIGEGEYLAVGGWTQQPVTMYARGLPTIGVGVVPSVFNQPSSSLYLLDMQRHPSDPGFVVATRAGSGNSPAPGVATLYSVGVNGLHAFGPTPDDTDSNGDGQTTIDDLYRWEQEPFDHDVNGDGVVSDADRALLIATVRLRGMNREGGVP